MLNLKFLPMIEFLSEKVFRATMAKNTFFQSSCIFVILMLEGLASVEYALVGHEKS